MFKKSIPVFFFFFSSLQALCQQPIDTSVTVGNNIIKLSEVVVNNKLDVHGFIERVKNDSSFYKAFKNLRILGFTAFNDIRILDKNNHSQASLYSKTKQQEENGCRT